ncbi:MAG: hypothetical protein U0521_23435 [Anaerolineae bacterium]
MPTIPLYAEFVGRRAPAGRDSGLERDEPRPRIAPGEQIDPRAYTELLRQAHDAIKAVDPTIKVVTGAPSPTGAEGCVRAGSRLERRPLLSAWRTRARRITPTAWALHYSGALSRPPAGRRPARRLPDLLPAAHAPARAQPVPQRR